MNPECPECGKKMRNAFGTVTDDRNDEMYEVHMGYECECGCICNLEGEEI